MVTAKIVDVQGAPGRVVATVEITSASETVKRSYRFRPNQTVDEALATIEADVADMQQGEVARLLFDGLSQHVANGTVIGGPKPPE
jgi:hypothetical protein